MSGTLLRVRCQNNWVMPVNVQLSMGDAAGSGISISAPPSGEIPPGGAACIDVRATAAARDTNAYLVAYQGTVNTSTLVATFRFTGEFEWAPGNPKNPITCTP